VIYFYFLQVAHPQHPSTVVVSGLDHTIKIVSPSPNTIKLDIDDIESIVEGNQQRIKDESQGIMTG
jgi:hypothetical protein